MHCNTGVIAERSVNFLVNYWARCNVKSVFPTPQFAERMQRSILTNDNNYREDPYKKKTVWNAELT